MTEEKLAFGAPWETRAWYCWRKATIVDKKDCDALYVDGYDEDGFIRLTWSSGMEGEPSVCESIEKWCKEHDVELPFKLRVYAAKAVFPKVDVRDMLERELDEAPELVFDNISDFSWHRLQKLVDGWMKTRGIRWYEPDLTRRVLMPYQTPDFKGENL